MRLKIPYKLILLQALSMLSGLAILVYFLPRFSAGHILPVLLFAAALAGSRLLDIQLPQGGKLHIDTAVIIASIILFPISDTLVIILIGIIASAIIKQFKIALARNAFPLSLKINATFASTYVFYYVGGRPGKIEPFYGLLSLLIACGVYILIDLGLDQLTIAFRRGTPYIPGFVSAIRFLGPIYLSLSSIGMLLALMYRGMGYWSLIVFFLPLSVARLSFKSFLDIRNVYRKTIEALANAIEAQNPSRHGHGRRVANYSVDIAKEIGIHGRELELIGYAALLHDIGLLGVDEDSLDQLLEQTSSQSGEAPHAIMGAEVMEQVDFLKDAADMVRKHHFPIDRAKSPEDIPIGARIINAASCFDKLTRGDAFEEKLTSYQAISRMKKDQGMKFDPKVIRALINVLRKQGKLMEYVS